MANKSKAKGTAAETRVVNYLKASGLDADRLALKGNKDEGDVWCKPSNSENNIHLEVKAGKQTQNYSRTDFNTWIAQTNTEQINGQKPCYLVIARHGRNIKDYEVWDSQGHQRMFLDEFAVSLGGKL